MSENDKEVLINFVKYNKFYKDEKDGRLIITIDFELKDKLDKSIKKIIEKHEETQSDLYEANNRIDDLLLILGDRDRMIDLMVEHIYTGCDFDNNIKTKEQIRKYFEERCK